MEGSVDKALPPVNRRHRYLIQRNSDRAYVSSTDNLGLGLPDGHVHVDTIGVDGLGTKDGRKGIPDFLKARARTGEVGNG